MALDTTGISNENEFYSDHYLRAILENDLKEVFSRWKEDSEKNGSKPPYEMLQALPKNYFRTKANLEKINQLSDIFEEQQDFVYSLHQSSI